MGGCQVVTSERHALGARRGVVRRRPRPKRASRQTSGAARALPRSGQDVRGNGPQADQWGRAERHCHRVCPNNGLSLLLSVDCTAASALTRASVRRRMRGVSVGDAVQAQPLHKGEKGGAASRASERRGEEEEGEEEGFVTPPSLPLSPVPAALRPSLLLPMPAATANAHGAAHAPLPSERTAPPRRNNSTAAGISARQRDQSQSRRSASTAPSYTSAKARAGRAPAPQPAPTASRRRACSRARGAVVGTADGGRCGRQGRQGRSPAAVPTPPRLAVRAPPPTPHAAPVPPLPASAPRRPPACGAGGGRAAGAGPSALRPRGGRDAGGRRGSARAGWEEVGQEGRDRMVETRTLDLAYVCAWRRRPGGCCGVAACARRWRASGACGQRPACGCGALRPPAAALPGETRGGAGMGDCTRLFLFSHSPSPLRPGLPAALPAPGRPRPARWPVQRALRMRHAAAGGRAARGW